ncbi:MAG: hypothetical protein M1561_02730 [Gammaproteobacteria bacterium]|nr:hypothetical protein [Gammaproteobacteria bacterium]
MSTGESGTTENERLISTSGASSSASTSTDASDPNTTITPADDVHQEEYSKNLRNKALLDLFLYLFFAAATFLIYAQKALNVTSLASQAVFIAFSFAIALIEIVRTFYHRKDFLDKKAEKREASDYLKIAASTLTFMLFLISGITNAVNFGAEPTEVINFMNSFGFPLGFIGISTMLLIVHWQGYSKTKQEQEDSKTKNLGHLFAGFIFVAISLMSLGLIPGAIYGLPSLWPGVGIAMITLGAISAFQNRDNLFMTPAKGPSTLQQPTAVAEEKKDELNPLVDHEAITSDEPKVIIPPRTKTRAWLDFFSAITFAAVAFILYARIPLGITNELCTGFLAAISGLQVIVEAFRIGYNIRDIRRKKAKGEEGSWSIFWTKVVPSFLLVGLSTWVVYSRAFELAGSSTIFGVGSTAAAMDFSIKWLFPIGYSCVSPFLLVGAIKEYWYKAPRTTEDLIKPFIFLTLSILSTGLVASAYFALPDLWVPVGLIITAIAAASLYLDWNIIRGKPPQSTGYEEFINEDERAKERAETLVQQQSLLSASATASDSASLAATASVGSNPLATPTFAALLDKPNPSSSSLASATASHDSSGLSRRPQVLPDPSASAAQSSAPTVTNSNTSLPSHAHHQ